MDLSSDAIPGQPGTGATARLRQGIRAIALARRPVPLPQRFAQRLPDEVRHAWDALAPFDQRHLIAVARDLSAAGHHRHVVLAGLLHDIGKAGRISLAARVARVLLSPLGEAIQARWAFRLGRLPGLVGLHLLLRHANTGADLIERSGLPAEVAWLVRHHERAIDHPELRALQAADRRN